MKVWSLPKHENVTAGKKYCGKEEKAISPLFHNIFNISLTNVQTHIYLFNVVNRIIFSSNLQIWYVEVQISRSISESLLEFEITRVDCIILKKRTTETNFASQLMCLGLCHTEYRVRTQPGQTLILHINTWLWGCLRNPWICSRERIWPELLTVTRGLLVDKTDKNY